MMLLCSVISILIVVSSIYMYSILVTSQTTTQTCQSRATSVPSNQSRQPNPSDTLTSFETLTTCNHVVQTANI